MQFAAVSMAFFVALASATNLHGQHFHHRRHFNASSSTTGEMTTLTVYATRVRTITSCAPTVTNCPAESATHVAIVTDTVTVATTVCPVESAEAASSSALAAAHVSKNMTAAVALSTSPTGGVSGYGGLTHVEGSTPAYVLGVVSSSTDLTTTIKSTTTVTERVTRYMTSTKASPTGQSGDTAATPEAAASQPTTTITTSSTSTRYITVSAVKTVQSTTSGSPINLYEVSTGSSDSKSCVPITVTLPQVTVTVTYSPMSASPTVVPVTAEQGTSSTTSTTVGESSAPSAISGSPSGRAPYGYSNGTQPIHHRPSRHSHGSSSSGFHTKSKPTGVISSYGY